jgi:hypothetical protein
MWRMVMNNEVFLDFYQSLKSNAEVGCDKFMNVITN